MNQIPLLAWIAIIVIVLIFIAVNLGLVAMLRSRGQADELARRLQQRRPSQTAKVIQNVREVMRDPFRQEREQLNELSDLVSRLHDPDSPGAVPPKAAQQDPGKKP